MSHVTRPRSARGEGDRLRDELIVAALRLLSAAGNPEDVSIRAVAKAAGVSPTATYRHFADRDALLEAACSHCFELFAELLSDASAGATDPFERLQLAGRAYMEYARHDEGLYRVLFSNPLHMDKDFTDPNFDGDEFVNGSAGKNAFVVLVDMVQECLNAGAPVSTAHGPADATYLAFQVWTWMHGMVDLRITHPGLPWPDAQRMLDDVTTTLGLVPPPARLL